jgi:hypothetical protein
LVSVLAVHVTGQHLFWQYLYPSVPIGICSGSTCTRQYQLVSVLAVLVPVSTNWYLYQSVPIGIHDALHRLRKPQEWSLMMPEYGR